MVTTLPLTKGKHKADCTLQFIHNERESEKEIPSRVYDYFSENCYDQYRLQMDTKTILQSRFLL